MDIFKRMAVAVGTASLVSLTGGVHASLVGHWSADEGTGAVVDDSAVADNFIEFTGSIGWTTGVVGSGALDHSGGIAQRDSGGLGGPFGLPTGSEEHSLLIWANQDVTENAIFGGYGNPAREKYFGIGTGYLTGANLNNDELTFYGFARGDLVTTLEVAPVNTWGLYAVTFTSPTGDPNSIQSGTVTVSRAFDDGGFDFASQSGTEFRDTLTNATPRTVAMGGLGQVVDPNQQRRMDGQTDDMSIWDVALTEGEIKSVYFGGLSVLDYDASEMSDLFDVHNQDETSAVVDGLEWFRVTGLSGDEGVFTFDGADYTVIIDAASGTGVSTVPEPATAALALAGALTLLRRRSA